MRISRMIQSMLLSALILIASVRETYAFFFLPPMPWDVEVDFPANAGKIVSNVKAYLRQLQTIKSEIASQKLEVVKAGQKYLKKLTGVKTNEGGKSKAPGKGVIKNDSTLGITKEGLDEEEVFNAMFRLFFVYPELKEGITLPVLKTVYRKKAIEYKQDITMETYLIGRVTEEYLSIVEKTIDRLDKCQKMQYNEGEMSSNCVFFGLQMVYIDPERVSEGDPENSEEPGQIGADMNAYIVTVVYDKLLQIVENLTAMEAQFQATKQIEMVDPIVEGEAQSNAEEYIKPNFLFANATRYEFANAAYWLSKRKRNRSCNPKKDVNCPATNADLTQTPSPENTEVLKDLQLVENKITEAMNIHNTKTRLWEYKSLYRKYLKSKEIHEKLLSVLKQSDLCAESFIRKYAAQGVNASELWGKPSVANQHNNRKGVSRTMLEEYQKYITETILGITESCEGYYEVCPDGTTQDPEKVCPTDSKKYKCIEVTETVTYDTQDSYGDGSEMTPSVNTSSFAVNTDNVNDTDYLTDGTKANEVETENRKKAERPWLIGHNQVDKLTRDGVLVFKPWNDQKNLQYEYLRNKYRNIKMIIKSADQGLAAYKIANNFMQNDTSGSSSEIATVLQKVTSCKMPSQAVEDAYKDFCEDEFKKQESFGKYYRTYYENGIEKRLYCKISPNNDTGYIHAEKQEHYWDDGKRKVKKIKKTYDQRIKDTSTGGKMCDFERTPMSESEFTRLQEQQRAKSNCPGVWDFTINFLIKNYLPAVLGGCQATQEAQAQAFYNKAKNAGRIVAVDKLSDALGARVQGEQHLAQLAQDYNGRITRLRTELRNLLTSQKKGKDDVSRYTNLKNDEIQQLERSKQRLAAIDNELVELEARKAQVSNMPEDVFAIEEKIKELAYEKRYINGEEKQKPSHYNEQTNPDQYFKTVASCTNAINSLNVKIETEKRRLEVIQKEILRYTGDNDNPGLIKATAQEFAEKYIQQSEAEQANIEAKNSEFENMVETKNNGSEPNRMINQKQRYCYKKRPVLGTCKEYRYGVGYAADNLESSMVNVLYLDSGNLATIIEKTMNSTWFSDMASVGNLLKELGVPEKFVLADAEVLSKFGLDINLPVGRPITPEMLAKAVKDGMVKAAAQQVAAHIKNADKLISQEITSAEDEVNAVARRLKVSGENNEQAQESDTPNIYDRKNYGLENETLTAGQIETTLNAVENAENQSQIAPITKMHYELIKALRQPSTPANGTILENAGIELGTLLGIPEYCNKEGEEEMCTPYRADDDYFVALPARGAENKVNENDHNAGRDYLAPFQPLINIAPLRESFYYGPLDYDDTPRSGNSPAISQLLNYKYADEKVEYLPEVWRYLLARPNLREDKKYTQTFVERAYESSKLKNYINSFDNNHYRTLISRAGVYPCVLGGKVIDVLAPNDKAAKMSFAYNSNSFSNLPRCQEVSLYKNGVRHLLADFLPNKADKNNPALQVKLDKSQETQYDNYSELGQFLQGNMQYRGLLSGINNYLLDKNNNSNSIARQRADTAAFKRNVFGSFLETVNAENSAKKALEQNEKEVKDSLTDLCQQIHEHSSNVNGECTENTEECKAACVQFIVGLSGRKAIAYSSEDNNYDVNCSKEEESIYAHFFCDLDKLKEQALAEAKKEYANLKKKYGSDVLNRVKEYTDEIDNYFAAFQKDPNEVAVMKPKATAASQEKAVKTTTQDQKAVREADEEGIISMGNQSQSVAYCPVY